MGRRKWFFINVVIVVEIGVLSWSIICVYFFVNWGYCFILWFGKEYWKN